MNANKILKLKNINRKTEIFINYLNNNIYNYDFQSKNNKILLKQKKSTAKNYNYILFFSYLLTKFLLSLLLLVRSMFISFSCKYYVKNPSLSILELEIITEQRSLLRRESFNPLLNTETRLNIAKPLSLFNIQMTTSILQNAFFNLIIACYTMQQIIYEKQFNSNNVLEILQVMFMIYFTFNLYKLKSDSGIDNQINLDVPFNMLRLNIPELKTIFNNESLDVINKMYKMSAEMSRHRLNDNNGLQSLVQMEIPIFIYNLLKTCGKSLYFVNKSFLIQDVISLLIFFIIVWKMLTQLELANKLNVVNIIFYFKLFFVLFNLLFLNNVVDFEKIMILLEYLIPILSSSNKTDRNPLYNKIKEFMSNIWFMCIKLLACTMKWFEFVRNMLLLTLFITIFSSLLKYTNAYHMLLAIFLFKHSQNILNEYILQDLRLAAPSNFSSTINNNKSIFYILIILCNVLILNHIIQVNCFNWFVFLLVISNSELSNSKQRYIILILIASEILNYILYIIEYLKLHNEQYEFKLNSISLLQRCIFIFFNASSDFLLYFIISKFNKIEDLYKLEAIAVIIITQIFKSLILGTILFQHCDIILKHKLNNKHISK